MCIKFLLTYLLTYTVSIVEILEYLAEIDAAAAGCLVFFTAAVARRAMSGS